MQGYETILVLDPDLNEDQQNELLDKFKTIVTNEGGQFVEHITWGQRKLAYMVKKRSHGLYHLLYTSRHGPSLKAMETQFRYEEGVLKWLSVTVEDLEKEKEKFNKLVSDGSLAQTLSER